MRDGKGIIFLKEYLPFHHLPRSERLAVAVNDLKQIDAAGIRTIFVILRPQKMIFSNSSSNDGLYQRQSGFAQP
jgi:hypothetical protein